MKRALYLMASGILHRRGNTLVLELPEGKEGITHKHFPIEQVQEILVFGEVTLNKRTLEFLSSHEVLVHFFNRFGMYIGSFYPREHYNSGYMLVKQVEHYLDQEKRLDLARRFVEGALQNMLQVLRYYINRGKEGLQSVYDCVARQALRLNDLSKVEQLMQAEGQAREAYYKFGSAYRIPSHQQFSTVLFEPRRGGSVQADPCGSPCAFLSSKGADKSPGFRARAWRPVLERKGQTYVH